MRVPGNCFEGFRPTLMATKRRHSALTGPSAVAIHDDGEMMWVFRHRISQPCPDIQRLLLNLRDFLFLAGKRIVDHLHMIIGQFLDVRFKTPKLIL